MDLASVFLTLFINIFFRKSFAFRCDILQLSLLAGLFSSRTGSVTFALFATGFVALAIGKTAFPGRFSRVSLLLPNWDKQDILNFLCTFSFVCTARGTAWSNLPNLRNIWTAVPILSVFQLCRNPASLKAILRPIRVGFGPTSILTASVAGLQQLWICATANSDPWPVAFMKTVLALVVLTSSLAAGTVFRPDNPQVMALLPGCIGRHWPDVRSKIKTHGCLNVVSVLCAVTVIVLDNFPTPMF